MSIEVRAATRDDADGITDVQVASWRAGYARVFPDSLLSAEDFETSRRAFWRTWRFAPGHRIAVAVAVGTAADRIVGFSSYGPERELAGGVTDRGEVWAFYLHPEVWGTGVASTLMTQTEEHLAADGFDTAVLWVLDDNPRARAFYEKLGWVTSGIVADFDASCDVRVSEVEYRKDLA